MSDQERVNKETVKDMDSPVQFDAFRMGINENNDVLLEFGVREGDDYRTISQYSFERNMFHSLLSNCMEILIHMQEKGLGFDNIVVKPTPIEEEEGGQK